MGLGSRVGGGGKGGGGGLIQQAQPTVREAVRPPFIPRLGSQMFDILHGGWVQRSSLAPFAVIPYDIMIIPLSLLSRRSV